MRVVRNCAERYGKASGLYEALSDKNEIKALDESLWILAQMMEAGAKYAKEKGIPTGDPLNVEQLYDCCDFADLAGIRAAVMLTVTNGRKNNVEAEYSPNAEATQGS